jgi:hypothetical protein
MSKSSMFYVPPDAEARMEMLTSQVAAASDDDDSGETAAPRDSVT